MEYIGHVNYLSTACADTNFRNYDSFNFVIKADN